MNLSNNCAICRKSMLRKAVSKLIPCKHLFHVECCRNLLEETGTCPMCRGDVERSEQIIRRINKRNSPEDRERIVQCANRGEDWTQLARTLNIKYKTAHQWISSGRINMLKKGGKKKRIMSEEETNVILRWLEEDCGLTLKQIQQKIITNFSKSVAISTIGNLLEGQLYSTKKIHAQPVTMNTAENKELRARFVEMLNNNIRNGKQIIWIDQTNFNLFCRRSTGRSRIGQRAVLQVPASRGPNIHWIGGISTAGVVLMERRRGSFTAEEANAWISRLLESWEQGGNRLEDLVIVCDNAPCHARLENVLQQRAVTLLRLAPYSPMLNPIEIIWSKVKSFVKAHLRVPIVVPPNVGEQRLQHLEEIIDLAKNTITGGDCSRAMQHCTSHYGAALAREDMPVGN